MLLVPGRAQKELRERGQVQPEVVDRTRGPGGVQDRQRVGVGREAQPHLVGVPHRMNWFNKILDILVARKDTIFVTPSQIADWYAKVEPAPADMKV